MAADAYLAFGAVSMGNFQRAQAQSRPLEVALQSVMVNVCET